MAIFLYISNHMSSLISLFNQFYSLWLKYILHKCTLYEWTDGWVDEYIHERNCFMLHIYTIYPSGWAKWHCRNGKPTPPQPEPMLSGVVPRLQDLGMEQPLGGVASSMAEERCVENYTLAWKFPLRSDMFYSCSHFIWQNKPHAHI